MAGRGGPVRVENLRVVQAQLRKLDADLPKELRALNKSAAEIVADQARPHVPVQSGKLVGTLKARGEQRGASVKLGTGKRVPYAPPIHWGWPKRGIEPNPAISEALKVKYDDVVEYYDQAIADLITKAGLN